MGKKGDFTKQHIRHVAFELFAEYGYKKVTMQDICTKSGLSKGGLYRHYEDKRQVFTDILKELQKEEADKEALYMRQDLSAAEILNGYLQHIRQDLNKNVSNINIALYEFCIENKDGIGEELLYKQYRKGEAILLSLVEYGISKGEFHLSDPQGAVSTILFLVEGLRMTNEVMEISDEILTGVFSQIKEMVGLTDEKYR